MNTELKPGINWVGYVDWTVRNFHGYVTDRGSTYNSYLVQDEKVAVVDSVKAPYAAELLKHIQAHTPLEKVDYVVCNHAEPDHSGSIPVLMRECKNAVLVADEKCIKALGQHYNTEGWKTQTVKTGDSISLGKRTLQFVETPMVHWPESMFTYIPEEKLLFSMDAFGQHFASAHRFDDEEPYEVIMEEAKTYYANIVMLLARPIQRALEQAKELDIEMIAPSHGVIWRKYISEISNRYVDWVNHRSKKKVLIVFDTMWKSTEMMAQAILEGVVENNVDVRYYNVNDTNITVLATEILDSAAIAIGSPTLNMTLMPNLAGALTYWKGLKPAEKVGFAFGSYGWSRGGAKGVQDYLQDMKVELMREPIETQFVPTAEVLEECRNAGRELGRVAMERGVD